MDAGLEQEGCGVQELAGRFTYIYSLILHTFTLVLHCVLAKLVLLHPSIRPSIQSQVSLLCSCVSRVIFQPS